MRTLLATTLSAVVASAAFAQTAPTVSNVIATQRADGSRLVDVFYDLSHNAPSTVWVVFSGDGGVSWNVPAMTLIRETRGVSFHGHGDNRSVRRMTA